jgi:hypothetical protein
MAASASRQSLPDESARVLQPSQASPVVPGPEVRSTDVDLSMALGWLGSAMSETGWGVDSLAEYMERDKSYISRVLSGDKPLGLIFILGMPEDMQAKFSELYAKHWGYLVVRPVSPDVAIQHLVSGLIGMLTTQPIKTQMARAGLRSR